AGWIHPDREITDQSNPHPRFDRSDLCRTQRAIGNPLQEAMEHDLLLVRGGENRHRGTGGIAQIGWPPSPVASAIGALSGVQRLEHCMLPQEAPSVGAEAGEV